MGGAELLIIAAVVALLGWLVTRSDVTFPVLVLLVGFVWWRLMCRMRWHPWATLIVATFVALVVVIGLTETVVVVVASALLLGLARRWYPAGFERWIGCRARTGVRFELVYAWRWNKAMTLFGLAAQVPGEQLPGRDRPKMAMHRPELVWMRSEPTVDRLLVRHRLGHEQTHWDIRTAPLAESFRAHSCSVTPYRPGYLWLTFRHTDTLTRPVRPLAPVPVGDVGKLLEAIPVGVTEDGEPWTLRLRYSHLLIGGATEAGKSSLIWSILNALAPSIAAGLVQVRGVDPKGNELRAGRALFDQLAYPIPDPDTGTVSDLEMVELLEDTARLVTRRAARLGAAGQRRNIITTEEPAVIVIVDELAYLGLYMADGALKGRAVRAMGTIKSQGRAVDVMMIGAVQDGRKEAVPGRDLFTVRVGLRTTEAAHADLFLGDGAYKAGALCDRIPETLAGVGYVRIGERRPIRVRSSYLNDNDVTTLAATYPAPRNLVVIDGDAQDDKHGEVAA